MSRLIQSRVLLGLAVSLVTTLSTAALAQPAWDAGIEPMQRFLLYPRVDAGLRALDQKRFNQAAKEFEYTLERLPGNPAIVSYLADAKAGLGLYESAIALLSRQFEQTPEQTALMQKRDILLTQWFDQALKQGHALQSQAQALEQFLDLNHPKPTTAYQEFQWLTLLSHASSIETNRVAHHVVRFADNSRHQREFVLAVALQSSNDRYAIELLNQWPKQAIEDSQWIEQISFELVQQNRPALALRLLIRAYPFSQADSLARAKLFVRLLQSQQALDDTAVLADFSQQLGRQISNEQQERDWLVIVGGYLQNDIEPLMNHRLVFESNRDLMGQQLIHLMERSASLPTGAAWEQLILYATDGNNQRLATISYRLIESDQDQLAWQILMAQFPFTDSPTPMRELFLRRLAVISNTAPALVTAGDQNRLAAPLPEPESREIQAAILKALGHCDGVRTVLGQYDASQTAVAWHMLGQCYETLGRPGLAQVAFQNAVSLRPTTSYELSLAYTAYANHDYDTALRAWRRLMGMGRLKADDWLAAIVTAQAMNQIPLVNEWLAQYEAADGPQTALYWSLKAHALIAHHPAQAIAAMEKSVALQPSVEHSMLLSTWQRQVGDTQGAIATLQNVLRDDPDLSQANASLGFILYSLGDMQGAQTHLMRALASRPGDERITQQLAYTHQRLGQNKASVQYAEAAIDQLMRYTPEERTDEQTQTLYNLRRLSQDLNRRWTFSADTLIGSSAVASADSPAPGQNFQRYTQLELDYRLGNPAIDDGKTVSAYVRVFGASTSADAAWSMRDAVLGVGLRWKPLSNYVVYLALEKQTPLTSDSSQSANTLARVSASFFNDGKYSDDWHPLGAGWVAQNLYLDAAYYIESNTHALTADYRIGYHHKLAAGSTIEPYSRLMANQLSTETVIDLRVAAGMRWNIWSRESLYQAYASRFYIGVEAQAAIATFQRDRFAVLLTVSYRW